MTEKVDYLEGIVPRLATQYKESLNLINLIRIAVTEANNLEDVNFQLLEERWVDTAEGVQLDILGSLVGQPRVLVDASALDYFGFAGNIQSNSFGTLVNPQIGGRFRSVSESTIGFRQLSDTEYRIFIKGKILKNNTNGTINEVISQINFLFPQAGDVTIIEGAEASYTVSFSNALSQNDQLLIGQTDLIIKPVGVSVQYIFLTL